MGEVEEELWSGPEGLAEEASFHSAAIAKHKKKHKPVLLGKGKVKLKKPGKATLKIKLNHKGKKGLAKVRARGIRQTIKTTVKSHGTLVTKKSRVIKVKPAKKKHKKHH